MLSIKTFRLGFIFTCLLLVILHPYTQYGKPGLFVAFMLTTYGLYHGINRKFAMDFLAPATVLMVIGCVGVGSSVVNGIFQVNHLMVAISFYILLLSAYGLWVYCQRRGLSNDEIITTILVVIFFNSLIITLELFHNPFRLFVEAFLDPLEGGSIDYAQGYRLRGLASSGGAGLSISVPAALVLSLHLFERKKLPLVLLVPVAAVLIFSVVVIGRTGLVLTAVPFVIYITFLLKRRLRVYTLVKGAVVFAALSLFSISLFPYFGDFYTAAFGESFVFYAYGFLLEGMEGIEAEGSVGIIGEFLTVLPLELPHALVGTGFYGGSEFTPWTDSGYARMFLSVGFLFGLIFYAIIYNIYFRAFKGNEFLFGSLILLLAIAELKEPLLFSGVASRMFIFVLVFCWFDKYSLVKINRAGSFVLPNSGVASSMSLPKP